MRGLFKIFLFTFVLISSGYQAYAATCNPACGKGEYCKSAVAGCMNCPAGYTDGTNVGSENECYKTCTPGGRITGGERVLKNSDGKAYARNNGECEYSVKCDAGYYVNASGDACSPCPTGSYQTSGNFTGKSCTLCATGYKNSGTANIAACATQCSKYQAENYAPTSWKEEPTAVNYCVINRCKAGFRVNGNDSSNSCTGYKYKIKFNVNAGSAQADKDCTYGQMCSWSNTTTKDGATFNAWAVNSSLTTVLPNQTALPATFTYPPYSSLAIPTSDNSIVNLYAKWQNCPNPGASAAHEWGTGCKILSCKAQYYVIATDDGNNGCKLCDETTAGQYCPGGVSEKCPTGLCPCDQGYYCPGNVSSIPATCDYSGDTPYLGRCKCPIGATTADTGAKAITACRRTAGSGGTKYCDSNGCFYLPIPVPYGT